ncbi:G-protein coupled receptor family C group 5 member C isoform X1 [Syngnathus scovelli]|uniref:G-protein coupled receptor family C group 5 member C isoform X1 n=1 Tax=Syngnathus scovelli TaxID=161590 RepID=UPI00210FFF87|nr:G-protein coupled receptor family C group 5 member C isoform X1 [Syngnathus scovelli]
MERNASRPAGCGPQVPSLYFKLCDLQAAWGVAAEALAAAGAVLSLLLSVTLLASVPFVRERQRRNGLALHAIFLVCTGGLFGLTFAFVVGENLPTCVSRRFLFGVLFAGCFSCLLVQGVRLNALARGKRAPPALSSCLAATALWAVEAVVNAEWLIITVARQPATDGPADAACNLTKADFVMALIYVMALLGATLCAGLGVVVGGKEQPWRREGTLILACAFLSAGIWVAWIALYVRGSEGGPRWDEPTLAVALVANAWIFLATVAIPQVCCSAGDGGDGEPDFGQDAHLGRAVGYENVVRGRNVFADSRENKAFAADEPAQGGEAVSPYSGYTGQLRSSVYQPTELAIISEARNPPGGPSHSAIPRASGLANAYGNNDHASSHRRTEW